MKRALLSFTSVLGVLVLAISSSPASASPSRGELDEETKAAAAYYAEEEGVSESVAHNILNDQSLINSAASSQSDTFSTKGSIRFEPQDKQQQIIVRSDDQSYVDSITSVEISNNSVFVVEDKPSLSESDLEVSDETVEQLRESIPGVMGVWIREDDGALMVDAEGPAETVETFASSRANSTRTKSIAVDGYDTIIVEYGDGASDTISVRGGTAMAACTAGFPAKMGSYIGFISAAHCANSTRVYGATSATGSSTTATSRKKVHNKNADIAFYSVSKTGNTWTNTRYAASATTPVATGRSMDPATGTSACRRGKTQGWKCGKITSLAYKPVWNGACPNATCNSAFVRYSTGTKGGDSGGPVTVSGQPVGVHKGGNATSFSVYSKISRSPGGVNVAGYTW